MTAVTARGRVRLQVREASSGLLVCERDVSNVMCTAGLNYLAQAALWSAVEDQNAAMGSPFTATYLAPIFGAVGSSAASTFTLAAAVAGGTNYTSVSAATSQNLPAGSYITLGYGTNSVQTVEVPTAQVGTTVNTASFTATATFPSGSAVGVVTPGDTALGNELGRQVVVGGGSSSSPATWTVTFFYGTTPTPWTVTEAGLFVNATTAAASGLLLDHAIVPATTKGTGQTLTAQFTFSMGGQ